MTKKSLYICLAVSLLGMLLSALSIYFNPAAHPSVFFKSAFAQTPFKPAAAWQDPVKPPFIPVKIPPVTGECYVAYPETITYINLEAVNYFTVRDNSVVASFRQGRNDDRLARHYGNDIDRMAVLNYLVASANACKNKRNPK